MADLGWLVKLTDAASTPADNIAKAMKAMDGNMKSAEGTLKSISAAMQDTTSKAKALSDALSKIKAPSLDGVKAAGLAASRSAATERFSAAMTVSKGISRAYEAARQTQTSRDDALAANLVKGKLDRLMSVDKRSMELIGTGMKQKAGSGEWWAKSSSKGVGPGPSLFSKLIGMASSRFGEGAGQKLLGGAQTIAGWDQKLQGWGTSLEGVAKTGLGAIGIGAAAAVASLAAIGVALGAIIFKLGELAVAGAAAFTKFAVQTLSFRENTLIAFETMLKSKTAANDLYKAATKFAAATPFTTDQVMGAYQRLLVGGFKTSELETMMNAVGDVAAMKGFDPQVMNEMIAGFAKLRGMGKLSGEVLEMEAFQGIRGNIIKQLAIEKGKTADEIQNMISAGKIDAASAEAAILNVIKDTYSGGKLGGAMEKFSSTWTGLWSTLESRGSDLFNAAASKTGSGLSRYYESIKTFVKWLGEALNPDSKSGARIVNIIDRIGGAFSKLFGGGLDDKKMTGIFDGLLTVIETVMPYFEAFMTGLGRGFGDKLAPLGKMLQELTGKPDTVQALAAAFDKMGDFIGSSGALLVDFVGRIAVAIVYINMLASKVESAWNTIVSFFQNIGGNIKAAISGISLLAEGNAIGTSLIDGLTAGIMGGVAAVAGAASGAAQAAINAVRSTAEVHSPSRVFAQMGGYLSEGLAQGVTRKAPVASAAVADLVYPPSGSAVRSEWSAAGQASSSSSTGPTVVIESLTIHAENPDDYERKTHEFWKRVALQLNGAPA